MEHSRPLHVELSSDVLDRLTLFAGLLLRWNARINLIGRATEQDIWHRHIDDSLQLSTMLPPQTTHLVDLGSGAGFPGLVLAMACNIAVTLVEADQRKASFLIEAARLTQAAATVHATRVEHLSSLDASLITARAFAPLPKLLPLAARHLARDGVLLLHKGARSEAELTHAAAEWHMRVERFPSRTAEDATILRISELRPVELDH